MDRIRHFLTVFRRKKMDRNMMMDQVMKTAGECDIVVSGLKTGGITCHLLR